MSFIFLYNEYSKNIHFPDGYPDIKSVLQTVRIQDFRYRHFMKGLTINMDTIGERIIFLREEREISQKALAIEIGITATTLSRYENGIYEPKAEIIRRLAVALDTTSDFLIGLCTDFHKPDELSPHTNLSAEEYRLIKNYRDLNESNRARIEERVLTLHELEGFRP